MLGDEGGIMKRTTLIAIAVGSILGAALPGAYAQETSPDQQRLPTPQANPPAVGTAGPSAPQTAPVVGQAGPAAQTPAPAVGQAGPNPATDQANIQRDKADIHADRA